MDYETMKLRCLRGYFLEEQAEYLSESDDQQESFQWVETPVRGSQPLLFEQPDVQRRYSGELRIQWEGT